MQQESGFPVITFAIICQLLMFTVLSAESRSDKLLQVNKYETWLLAQADTSEAPSSAPMTIPPIPPADVIPASKAAEPPATTVPEASPATSGQNEPIPQQAVPVQEEKVEEGLSEKEQPRVNEEKKEEPVKEKGTALTGLSWEVSAGSVTVDGKQWVRLSVSPDIPIWRFGLGLDIECFLDEKGDFSDKGWNFDERNWKEAIFRKIKYLRFNNESDPFFAKIGGISNVTLGYGFIVDRFTNLLHYPDDKLLGAQLYLNELGPIGFTLQTMAADIMEFTDNGGIFAARIAATPLKITNLPFVNSLSVGATYAMDINEFAPAGKWHFTGNLWDKNNNGRVDWDWAISQAENATDSAHILWDTAQGIVDGANVPYNMPDTVYRDSTRGYAILGGDIGIPIFKNNLFRLDLYGQAGVVVDSNMFNSGSRTGWGFGAPGVRLSSGVFTAQIEYRHVKGKFTPSYFNKYYLDERVIRYPYPPRVKSDELSAVSLDGVYGLASVNLFDLVKAEAGYQLMAGKDEALDQRFEAHGYIGEVLLNRIPKVNKAEIYFYKTNINRTVVVYTKKGNIYINRKTGKPVYDEFFEQTPFLFWGYRIGLEITKGAALLWDVRYGYQWTSLYRLEPYNNISIGAFVSF